MSEAYERERQNNARLDELSAKVSALRGVTIDIYDHARSQDVIDSTVRSLPSFLPSTVSHRFPTKQATVLTYSPPNSDRHLFIHGHSTQRVRDPSRAHGRGREQGRRPQTLGHLDHGRISALLHLQALLRILRNPHTLRQTDRPGRGVCILSTILRIVDDQ